LGLKGGLARVVACEKPAHDQKQCAERKEAEVVGGLVASAFADVVEAEDVVIDKALHQVEGTPAEEDPADQCLSACRPAPLVCSSPQNPKADHDDDPCEGVEESVCERVVLKPRNGRFRMPPSLLSMWRH
jgi:hypothetical protein